MDVDGVLNRGSFDKKTGGLYDGCIEQLRQLVLHTQAKIVVSSSWKDSDLLLTPLSRTLNDCGMSIFDTTEYRSNKPREVEIQEWLDKHPDIENYVVLDDWDLSKEFPGHMVNTCDYDRIGLDDEWRIEAENILLDNCTRSSS